MDTAFDPDTMETIKVPFLSEDYFSLSKSRPELAGGFALGPQVIAISDGIVYEVVASDETTAPIEIPPALVMEPTRTIIPETQNSPERSAATPVSRAPEDIQDATSVPIADAIDSSDPLTCLGSILPLLLLPMGVLVIFSRTVNRTSARFE
jgi:hypothetical protein